MSIVVSDTSSSRRGTSTGPVMETRTLVRPGSEKLREVRRGATRSPDCGAIGSGERVCGKVLGEEHAGGSFHIIVTVVMMWQVAKIYAGDQIAYR
jgi:hypothetical protein